MSKHEVIEIKGSGGGKGGKTIADNLQSRAVARFTDLISEGPIVGLVNGAKSIYFNETPLQNEDGSFNFENVIWEDRKGLPDDAHLNGNSSVENLTSVEVEIKNSGLPIQRTITAPDADAVRIIIRLNSLISIDDKGNTNNNSVSYAIDIRPVGGAWVRAVTREIKDRKTTSPTQIAHRIQLPAGTTAWDVRLTRLTPDDIDEKHQSVIYWESYVTLIEGRFIYPHSALVGIEVNAEDLGTQIPQRSYHVKGRIIDVPVNYDPIARIYSGVWNGTFKQAWTDEPAWIFYDLIENDRYGIGEFVDRSHIDKWSLYQIAVRNSGQVKSGFKDANGNDIYEPRHTFNGVIQDREDAYFALQKITTSWRGMGYWAIGQYFATADMPSDPVKLVTPSNVINGEFVYSSTSMKSRHNVAIVNWNDPVNHFKPTSEVEILDEYMQKNGWRETRVDLAGCTSRGLALRYARWLLDTENTATETVTYSASFDHADLRPGDVIAIADPRRALVRMGGRIVSHTLDTVTLDADIALLTGETYQIYLTNPDGSIQTLAISSRISAGVYRTTNSAVLVSPGSVFIITGTDVKPKNFRVVSIAETEPNIFSISALFHDPAKYARVENGVHADAPSYARERPVAPPTNVNQLQENYIEGGITKSKATLSWTPPEGVIVRNYVVFAQSSSSGKTVVGTTTETSIDIDGLNADVYTFEIVTVDRKGAQSKPAVATVSILGSAGLTSLIVSNLVSLGATVNSFEGQDISISWKNLFPATTNADLKIESSPLYRSNTVEIRDAAINTLLRTETVVGNSYTYKFDSNKADALSKGFPTARRAIKFSVKLSDVNNNQSPFTDLIVSNPAPSAVTPVITVEENFLNIAWPMPTDSDIAGYRVYVRPTSAPVAGVTPDAIVQANTYRFKGASRTGYFVSVVGYDVFGTDSLNYAAPVPITTSFIGSNIEPPAPPTGLALTGTLNAQTSLVDVVATWGAVGGDIDQYQLEISIAGNTNVVSINANTAKFSVAQGVTVYARVRVMDKTFSWSSWSSIVNYFAPTDSVAPAVPTSFTLTSGWGSFALEWTAATEPDFDHYDIWESATATAPVAGSTPRYATVSNLLMLTGFAENTKRYYAVRSVDIGGNKSAWTTLKNATTISIAPVTLPAPAAAPTVTTALNGSVSDVKLTWTDIVGASGYEVEVTTTGDNPVVQWSGTNQFKFSTQPGATGSARFRAVGGLGERSEWSAAASFTASKDTVAPATVTGLTAQAGINQIVLKWAASVATDLALYEIYQSTSTTTPAVGATATYKSASTTAAIGSLADNVTLNFWVRAVDTSGNKSAWSSRVAATTTTVQGLIETAITNATWSANLGFILPYVGAALPTTNIGKTISWNDKLYSWNGTAYVSSADFSAVSFNDLNGSIASSQIPNNAVSAAKIADGAIGAAKIADGVISVAKIAPDLNTYIANQGTSAAADAAAAQAARLAAESASAAAQGYRNDTSTLKDQVDVKSAEITQTAGVVAAAKNTSILASGNERFQFELSGWQMTGGRLTNLTEYRRGAVDAIFIFDAKNNVHQGIAVNFARNSTTTVTINGVSYTVPVNKPRFFVTVADGRYLKTSSGETMGIASSLGTVDVEITPRTGAKIVQKGVSLASGWWPAFGEYLSIVVWPAGTL